MPLLYSNVRVSLTLLNQDVSNGFDVLSSVIWCITLYSIVSTSVGIIMIPSSAKPDSRVSWITNFLVVSKDTDSCFGVALTTGSIEPFLVAVDLQGRLRTNQRLPHVTTQWRGTVFPVSNKCVQGGGLFIDDEELDLLTDLHTEADLGEGCVPVGRQLGLLCVEPSLSSRKVISISVAPKRRIVMESFLKHKQKNNCRMLNICTAFVKNNIDRGQLHTFVPSIFMASVHPPSPHPKLPMWQ